jgi:HEAT repeat protein
LLEHADGRVALLAIECIGEIGGPEHVAALLARIQLADTDQVNRAYDALARLGGPEAEGFLQFAARNEDEPVRRAAAERALQSVAESAIVDPRRHGRMPNRGHR